MSLFKRITAVILLIAVIIFMIEMPKTADKLLGRNQYREWMERREEPFNGMIEIWHIAGFKPYSGSLGNWIGERARKIEKRHFGVYFNVESITCAEAEKRMKLNKFPDAVSFPLGWLSGSALSPLRGDYAVDTSSGMDMSVLKAAPYAASCRVILYYPSKVTASELSENPELAEGNSPEEFKKGKQSCCIADARFAGDMTRALMAGKAEYFEVLPIFDAAELIQYIGISINCGELKRPYIEELIRAVLDEKAQSSLCKLGLMPFNGGAEEQYEQPFLKEAYALLRKNPKKLPNTFDIWQSRAETESEALIRPCPDYDRIGSTMKFIPRTRAVKLN